MYTDGLLRAEHAWGAVNLLQTGFLLQVTLEVVLATLPFPLANCFFPEHGSLEPCSFSKSWDSITHDIEALVGHPLKALGT